MHVSAIGGFTPAWQAAQHAAMHDVRTAWHNPKDIAPIGVACNLHLDLASPNFGIQEFADWTEAEREIFAGLPEVRDGYLYPTDAPGWGITLDQAAAANYPASPDLIEWTQTRAPDGSLTRP
jgi:mannonate dehydratase